MTATARLAVLGALVLGACASPPKPAYVALLENPDGSTGRVFIRGAQGEQVLDKARHGAPLDGSAAPAPVAEEQLQQDFGAAMAAQPLLPERFLLYFESGGARLTAESSALLAKIVASAARRPGVDISIIGHTDTVDRAEANEALALSRAQAIAQLIREQGLQVEALSVESHGERNLLVPTADGVAEPRNRRVEVSIR